MLTNNRHGVKIAMRSLINKRKEQTIIMANFGLNFAMWILGLAGEHDADEWLTAILDLLP